jgi:tetratricopeptide (TPR) repeat protein
MKSFNKIVSHSLPAILFLMAINITTAQEERKIIRQGNKNFKEKNFEEALLNYKKASEINPDLMELNNNIGIANYRSDNFNDAASSFDVYLKNITDNKHKAEAFYNLGNSYLQAKDYNKSIQAYKNALRLDPTHDKSRYNMAVATKIQQQQQNQNNQNQNQQQNQQNQQNNQNKDNKDQDKDKNKDNNQNENDNKDRDKKQQSAPQQQENTMSREEMERFLESLQQKEKDLQEKLNKEKFKIQKRNIEKDW